MLTKCCQLLIRELERLRDLGEITKDEYQEHTKVKFEFLAKLNR